MRFTFVILLFCGLGADAQMIIKAHPNYRPYAVAAANLLLDDYSGAAAAYSIRKLRTAYTGNCIRVRRSNDNTEQDIGFTSLGDLDTATLKTFVGANSGFVTTWYDQSGDTLNLRQSTAANQPNIVNAGVIRRGIGNRPIINFDGTNDRLGNTASIALPSPVANSVFSVWSSENSLDTNTVRTIYEFANIQRLSFEGLSLGGLAFIGWPDANTTSINPSQYITYNPSQIYLLSLIYNGGTASNKDSYTAHRNGTLQTITQGGVFSALGRSTGLSIGARNTAIQHTSCAHREIIIYRSNQSSNRTGIETNINSYYGIY
jgi:hypothetical protein